MNNSFPIEIDDASQVPIYKQISQSFEALIFSGYLKMGHFLPSERILADELNIARGTVKKAYEELSNRGLVSTSVGKGTVVNFSDDLIESDIKIIQTKLQRLHKSGFSKKELLFMFQSYMDNNFLSSKDISIAVIECNPEVLDMIALQCSGYSMQISKFLLTDLVDFHAPQKILSMFPIIMTTSTHYDKVKEILYEEEKLINAVVSPDRETVMAMTLLKDKVQNDFSAIGLLGQSKRFIDIMQYHLTTFSLSTPIGHDWISTQREKEPLDLFLQNKQAIVMPPFHIMGFTNEEMDYLFDFKNNGGSIIIFNYVLEKGSLLHMEEKLHQVNENRRI